jgi:hypothetical protein
MSDVSYFAVINDNPVLSTETVTFCRDDGGDTHLYHELESAIEARDRLRDEYDNPDINVYKLDIDGVD